jgi:hypothetical protein
VQPIWLELVDAKCGSSQKLAHWLSIFMDLPVQKSPMGQGLVCGGSFGSHILQSGTAQPTYSFIALPTRKRKNLFERLPVSFD